jgi:SAM-dependent methyltransferase
MNDRDSASDAVRELYERWPFPVPADNLDDFRDGKMVPRGTPSASFYLYWPAKPARNDLDILIAGCGTNHAVEYALWEPNARIVAIDISQNSLNATQRLIEKYQLKNVELHRLPLERIGELNREFDFISTTGVLHHLPDPDAGLRALRSVLKIDGSIYVMVYAKYGRLGVYMLQDYARLVGVDLGEASIADFHAVIKHLPGDHPLMPFWKSYENVSPTQLADTYLHPQDRAYSVLDIYQWLDRTGMKLQRWFYQAAYSPRACELAMTPHLPKVLQLPDADQHAAVELFRGHLKKHYFVACRDDRPIESYQIKFDEPHWRTLIPGRLQTAAVQQVQNRPGIAGQLFNSGHEFPVLPACISTADLPLYLAMDGVKSLGEIAESDKSPNAATHTLNLYRDLWNFDHVMFRRA